MTSGVTPECAAAEAMLMTRPEPRSRIGFTNVWLTSSVPMRLLFVSVWMSSSDTSSALFGSGLPPFDPMSPPAQLTRMSTSPSSLVMRRCISATAAGSPMLPVTVATRPPCRAISRATSSRFWASPYFEGETASRSWIATSAPCDASFSAMVRPSPRPEPVTKAILPLRGPSIASLHQSERPHVRGAPSDHVLLVGEQLLARRLSLPRGPEVLVLVQQIHPGCLQRLRESAGVLGRIALPPVRGEQPDVTRLECA